VKREQLNETQADSPQAVQLLGECHPLLVQLGSADGLFSLSSVAGVLCLPEVDCLRALETFLERYQSQVLLPLELPAIYRAHGHASRNEIRELLALDLEIAGHSKHQALASASRRVGRSQLQRLRPLRDARVVRRYLQAVEQDRAQAWHTLVYGVTLAVYSLPVRQGLLSYARQTLGGFIHSAARPLHLSAADCGGLIEGLGTELPGKMEKLLKRLATHE